MMMKSKKDCQEFKALSKGKINLENLSNRYFLINKFRIGVILKLNKMSSPMKLSNLFIAIALVIVSHIKCIKRTLYKGTKKFFNHAITICVRAYKSCEQKNMNNLFFVIFFKKNNCEQKYNSELL